MKPYNELRIVFFGTPDFAVASLRALIDAGCNVIAVVTAADKPAGRGLQPAPPPVKVCALDAGLPILQPEKLKAPEFIDALEMLEADLGIVVAFRMLPEAVWNMPPMGTVNVHASLLPDYRGAAPIHWAVINGETETGVTTFRLKHEIDTGNILLRESVAISGEDTTGTLYEKLMHRGADLLIQTVKGLAAGMIAERPQLPAGNVRHAPKITKDTGRLDWSGSVDALHNLVRGLAPTPAAWTTLNGKVLKILKSRAEKREPAAAAGVPDTDGKSFLRFAAADGYLYVEELQLEGKKRMAIEEFLRGWRADAQQ